MFALAPALDAFSRLAIAIVCAALALTLWNLSARTPSQIATDVAHGSARLGTLVVGLFRFLLGVLLAVTALVLVRLLLPDDDRGAFSLLAILTFIAGLSVESLIGANVRRLLKK